MLQVVQHPFGNGDELPAGRRDLDAPRVAREERDTEHALDALDSACECWLRSLEIRRRGNEAAVLGQRQHGHQLAGTEVGDVGWMHSRLDLFARRNCICYRANVEISKPW